jgi:predicted ferric reductase
MAMTHSAPEAEPAIGAVSWLAAALVGVALGFGAVTALTALPIWAPALQHSFGGAEPHGFWYLSRASAFVAYALLWLSMALGVAISNKMARVWPGGPTAFGLHEYASLLGLVFAAFHALILLGDHYIGFTLQQALTPFASAYRPLEVGLGQIALYASVVVTFSFYVRRRIGQKAWRGLHFFSFAIYVLALLHGLLSGTDTGAPFIQGVYWITGGSLLFLTIYRLLARKAMAPRRAQPRTTPAPGR